MQGERQSLPRSILFFVAIASVGVSVWFISTYAALFNSFFLAIMIAMTASPVGFWLQEHGVPRWLSLTLSVLAALAATLLIAGTLLVTTVRLIDSVPMAIQGLAGAENAAGPILSQLGLTTDDLQEALPLDAAARYATSMINLLVESISMIGLVVLIVIFMILEAFLLPKKIENRDGLIQMPTQIAAGYAGEVRQYVGITSLLGILGGAVLAVILHLMDVPFYAHWGILYFVLSFVPMLGFWIAVIPPMLVAGQTGGTASAVLVLAAYMIVATVINQGIKPAVMRGGLDLSPFWSIVSLIVWSTVLGPVGLIVGVPLTVALKVLVFEPDDRARWLADLLSAGLPARGEGSHQNGSAE